MQTLSLCCFPREGCAVSDQIGRGNHQQTEEKKCCFFFASVEPGCGGGDAGEGFCTVSKLSLLLGRGFLFPGD